MAGKRVRTLLRVSSRQQLYDDDIPVQRAELAGYIAGQPDWELDGEYVEKAVSAYKNSVQDREVLMQIVADARNHAFDILLAYMSDRIGRREEYTFYISTLNSLGVEVWTVRDGKLKSEEHIDKLLNYIRFWQNEGESRKTSMRVKDARAEMTKAGKFTGGKAPYGYRLTDSGVISNHGRRLKKLEICEREAVVVRKIYHLYLCKGYGYEKIAKELNRAGIPAATTDQWKGGTVCGILRNPVYMGYFAIHRREKGTTYRRLDRTEWILSQEQCRDIVIVSQPDWEKAQEIRESRNAHLKESRDKAAALYEKQYHAPFNPRGRLALLGIAYCGYCGRRLKSTGYSNHWTTKDGTEKVSCLGRYGCPGTCRERSCYSQGFLEEPVLRVVRDYLSRLKKIDVMQEVRSRKSRQEADYAREEKAAAGEIERLTKDIGALEDKLPDAIRGDYCFSAEALARMIGERQERLKALRQHMASVRRKKEAIRAEKDALEKDTETAPDWGRVFDEADIPTRKMLLAALIERIDVRDDEIGITFRIRRTDFINACGEETVRETMGSDTIPYIPG